LYFSSKAVKWVRFASTVFGQVSACGTARKPTNDASGSHPAPANKSNNRRLSFCCSTWNITCASARPAHTATGLASTQPTRVDGVFDLHPNNVTGARWGPRDRPITRENYQLRITKDRADAGGTGATGRPVLFEALNRCGARSYETPSRLDRVRSGRCESSGPNFAKNFAQSGIFLLHVDGIRLKYQVIGIVPVC